PEAFSEEALEPREELRARVGEPRRVVAVVAADDDITSERLRVVRGARVEDRVARRDVAARRGAPAALALRLLEEREVGLDVREPGAFGERAGGAHLVAGAAGISEGQRRDLVARVEGPP